MKSLGHQKNIVDISNYAYIDSEKKKKGYRINSKKEVDTIM